MSTGRQVTDPSLNQSTYPECIVLYLLIPSGEAVKTVSQALRWQKIFSMPSLNILKIFQIIFGFLFKVSKFMDALNRSISSVFW